MNPDTLRAGLRVAMRTQRSLTRTDREALGTLIAAGVLVLRAAEDAARPAPVYAPGLLRAERRRRPPQEVPQTVPGDFSPTAYAGRGGTELATLQLGLER